MTNKKGVAVHLKEVFFSRKEKFQDAESELYGKKKSVRYMCMDLLWSILVSTSLELEPHSIIRLYKLLLSERIYLPGDETADWGILLSFLVKAYAKLAYCQKN